MSGIASWLRGSVQACVLLAALLWSLVGSILLAVGSIWSLQHGDMLTAWLLPLAVVLGLVKGGWILRRVSHRMIERLRARGDGQWLWGVMPARLWVAIGLMILTGNLLRRFVLPRDVAGLIYVGVGLALLLGARFLWLEWRRMRTGGTQDVAQVGVR